MFRHLLVLAPGMAVVCLLALPLTVCAVPEPSGNEVAPSDTPDIVNVEPSGTEDTEEEVVTEAEDAAAEENAAAEEAEVTEAADTKAQAKEPDFDSKRPSILGMTIVESPSGRAKVVDIAAASPAWDAGVRKGDVIVSLHGVEGESFQEWVDGVRQVVTDAVDGQTVPIELVRDGSPLDLQVKLPVQRADEIPRREERRLPPNQGQPVGPQAVPPGYSYSERPGAYPAGGGYVGGGGGVGVIADDDVAGDRVPQQAVAQLMAVDTLNNRVGNPRGAGVPNAVPTQPPSRHVGTAQFRDDSNGMMAAVSIAGLPAGSYRVGIGEFSGGGIVGPGGSLLESDERVNREANGFQQLPGRRRLPPPQGTPQPGLPAPGFPREPFRNGAAPQNVQPGAVPAQSGGTPVPTPGGAGTVPPAGGAGGGGGAASEGGAAQLQQPATFVLAQTVSDASAGAAPAAGTSQPGVATGGSTPSGANPLPPSGANPLPTTGANPARQVPAPNQTRPQGGATGRPAREGGRLNGRRPGVPLDADIDGDGRADRFGNGFGVDGGLGGSIGIDLGVVNIGPNGGGQLRQRLEGVSVSSVIGQSVLVVAMTGPNVAAPRAVPPAGGNAEGRLDLRQGAAAQIARNNVGVVASGVIQLISSGQPANVPAPGDGTGPPAQQPGQVGASDRVQVPAPTPQVPPPTRTSSGVNEN